MWNFSKPSQRFLTLKQRLLNAEPVMCIERARYYTASYKETEGEPMIIRRAKAIYKTLENMTLFVAEDDLFVGNQASGLRYVPVYPETETVYCSEEIDIFPVRDNDRVAVPREVKQELLEEIFPYWIDKNSEIYSLKRIPKESMDLINVKHQVFSPQIHMRGTLAHTIADYGIVLEKGFEGIKDQINRLIDKLDLTKIEDYEKYNFYKATLICADAAILLADRFAKLLDEKISTEKNAERITELEKLAQNCRRVPRYGARSFYEALQSFWFVHLILYIEQNGLAISIGRFDQFLYPYYIHDIREGILTQDQAQEYLDIIWIKFTEIMRAYDLMSSKFYGGFAISENLLIGGTDRDGNDVTNELSYMCLDSEFKTKLSQPNISIRVHSGTSEDFLLTAAKVIRKGGGKPQLFNDAVAIPLLIRNGATLEDARDYVISGCVEPVPPGTLGVTNASMSNLAKAFELAINNGKCRLCGETVGIETGDPAKFETVQELISAFEKQVEYYVKHMVTSINAIEMVHGQIIQIPFTSLTLTGCIESGRDASQGGARYSFTGPQGVGVADVADSLAAIEQVVFCQKKATMQELMDALDKNFEGNEKLRLRLTNAPKYGNDEDAVDKYARIVGQIYCRAVEKYRNAYGGIYRPGLYPVSANVPLGLNVGALPCGRLAEKALADGISPEHYMDLNGPTAVMRSAAKLDHIIASNGTLLNQKFNPSFLASDENLAKLISMIHAYFDMGGWHVQYNVVSAETLKQAQSDPAKFQGLLVRVAGYSAFFSELSKIIQDDIIERTEFESF